MEVEGGEDCLAAKLSSSTTWFSTGLAPNRKPKSFKLIYSSSVFPVAQTKNPGFKLDPAPVRLIPPSAPPTPPICHQAAAEQCDQVTWLPDAPLPCVLQRLHAEPCATEPPAADQASPAVLSRALCWSQPAGFRSLAGCSLFRLVALSLPLHTPGAPRPQEGPSPLPPLPGHRPRPASPCLAHSPPATRPHPRPGPSMRAPIFSFKEQPAPRPALRFPTLLVSNTYHLTDRAGHSFITPTPVRAPREQGVLFHPRMKPWNLGQCRRQHVLDQRLLSVTERRLVQRAGQRPLAQHTPASELCSIDSHPAGTTGKSEAASVRVTYCNRQLTFGECLQ